MHIQVIQLYHPYEPNQIPNEEAVMVLDFFDGVHKGHRKVIETGKKITKEEDLELVMMTFNQHPSVVFQRVLPEDMKYLTSLKQKERLMANLGVDILCIVEFTSASAQLKPRDFVDQYIVSLNSTVAVSGFDYMYGPKEIARVKQLPIYTQGRFEVVTVPREEMTGTKIGSTRIRRKMEIGEMKEVAESLGYIYETEGTVVHGDARGRLLGFPAASVRVKSTVRLPRIGIYAAQIKAGGKWYVGTGSIGHNDTFREGRDLTAEVYILDFHQDVYGEQVVVRWNHCLCGQVRFDGTETSIDQLKRDERDTADYFQQSEGK